MEGGRVSQVDRKVNGKRETWEATSIPVNGHTTRAGSEAYASFRFSFEPFHGTLVILQKRTEHLQAALVVFLEPPILSSTPIMVKIANGPSATVFPLSSTYFP